MLADYAVSAGAVSPLTPQAAQTLNLSGRGAAINKTQKGNKMEFVLIWVFFAILAAVIADKNGRSAIVWGMLGMFFGIFAVVIVAVMGKASRWVHSTQI